MINKRKQFQKGSPSRDLFKRKHKNGSNDFYASDLDLVLVSKSPPGIVAFIDYKTYPKDVVTFSEVLTYNALSCIAPIYLIYGDDDAEGPFSVYLYKTGNWLPEPPKVEKDRILHLVDWPDLLSWEGKLRDDYVKSTKVP
jgi:hypothetical protein